jgi:hypothetical protein
MFLFSEEQVKGGWKQQRWGFSTVAGYALWDKEWSKEIGSQLGTRELDKYICERKKNKLEPLQMTPSERAHKQICIVDL